MYTFLKHPNDVLCRLCYPHLCFFPLFHHSAAAATIRMGQTHMPHRIFTANEWKLSNRCVFLQKSFIIFHFHRRAHALCAIPVVKASYVQRTEYLAGKRNQRYPLWFRTR